MESRGYTSTRLCGKGKEHGVVVQFDFPQGSDGGKLSHAKFNASSL